MESGLMYSKLKKDTLQLRVYDEELFASKDALSSQLGFIIIPCNDSNASHVIGYSRKKSHRVMGSMTDGNTYAFVEAFGSALIAASDLSKLIDFTIPIHMLTDSKRLSDDMTKGELTTEERLMIDIEAARQSYRRFEIRRIGLVLGQNDPADSLTKFKDNDTLSWILASV